MSGADLIVVALFMVLLMWMEAVADINDLLERLGLVLPPARVVRR